MTEKKKGHMLLKMVVAAQIINEGMDELKHIEEFKGRTKIVCKEFETIMARHFNPLVTKVFNADWETSQKVIAGIERMCGATVFNIGKWEEIMQALENNDGTEVIKINLSESEEAACDAQTNSGTSMNACGIENSAVTN